MNIDQIIKIHDEIFGYLSDFKEENVDFYFMPRQRQSKKTGRLDQGYWFNGDEHYLLVNFYSGSDAINKTTNITFGVYLSDKYNKMPKTCYIELANTPNSTDYEIKKPVIEEILNRVKGFEININTTNGIPRRWHRYYTSTDYLKNIEEFVTKDKPIIDDIVKSFKNAGIQFLNPTKASEMIRNIENRRIKKE
jgi:hypothetical protein